MSLVTDDVIASPAPTDQRAEPVRRDDVGAALPAPRWHPRRRTAKGENKNTLHCFSQSSGAKKTH